MRAALCFCCLLLIGVCFQPAKAADLIQQSAWMEDPSGQLSLAAVKQRPEDFTPFTGVLTQGFSASAFWLRLRVGSSAEDKLIVRIRPIYLDHIKLFDPLEDSGHSITKSLSGDHHTKQGNAYKSLNHGFVIQGSQTARDIYIRLKSTSTLLAYAEVMSVEEAASTDQRQELLYTLYLGLLTAFLFWALLQWLTRRDLLITVFLIKQVFVLAHALAHKGYLHLLLNDLIAAPLLSDMTALLIMAYVLSGTAFVLIFLHEFKPAPWLWWLFTGTQAIYLPLLLLFLTDEVRLAMQINISLGTLSAVGFVLIAFSARAWQDKSAAIPLPLSRPVLIGFAVTQLLATLSATLPLLDIVKAAEWNLNAAILPGFVNSLLMTALLCLRARNLEKQNQQMLLDTNVFEQKARTEQLQREEQARFLSMLTHELKTPLTVVRINLDGSALAGQQRERIDRALANINGIIDRCAINEKLEHQQLMPQSQPCKLQVLLDECVQGCSDPSRVKVSERNENVSNRLSLAGYMSGQPHR